MIWARSHIHTAHSEPGFESRQSDAQATFLVTKFQLLEVTEIPLLFWGLARQSQSTASRVSLEYML